MRSALWSMLGFGFVLMICWYVFPQSKGTERFTFAAQIYAHRGSHEEFPENTLEALRQAKEDEAQGVEFDVQLTADGVPVVFHDKTLERLMGDKRPLDKITYAELKSLKFLQDPQGLYFVPTLEQVVDACLEQELLMDIELKEVSQRQQLVLAVLKIFESKRLYNKAWISSFDWKTLHEVRKNSSKIFTAWLVDHEDTGYEGWAKTIFQYASITWIPWFIGANGVIAEHKMIYNDAFIKEWQKGHYLIGAFGVNDIKTKDYLNAMGGLIITDHVTGDGDEEDENVV